MNDITAMVVFGALLAIALYDVLAIVRGGVKASVSQFVTNCSVRPRIAFVCGCLVSHFFGWVMIPDMVVQPDGIRARMFLSGEACRCEESYSQCEACQKAKTPHVNSDGR